MDDVRPSTGLYGLGVPRLLWVGRIRSLYGIAVATNTRVTHALCGTSSCNHSKRTGGMGSHSSPFNLPLRPCCQLTSFPAVDTPAAAPLRPALGREILSSEESVLHAKAPITVGLLLLASSSHR